MCLVGLSIIQVGFVGVATLCSVVCTNALYCHIVCNDTRCSGQSNLKQYVIYVHNNPQYHINHIHDAIQHGMMFTRQSTSYTICTIICNTDSYAAMIVWFSVCVWWEHRTKHQHLILNYGAPTSCTVWSITSYITSCIAGSATSSIVNPVQTQHTTQHTHIHLHYNSYLNLY